MAKKIGEAMSKAINALSKAFGTLQVNVNKILWGRGTKQPIATAKFDTKTGTMQYQSTPPPPPTRPVKGTLIDSGLFNALDALNSVDLCNVVNYLANNTSLPKSKRSQNPTAAEKRLYQLQDLCEAVVLAIDKYTAYPNEFIGSYAGIGPNAQSPDKVVSITGGVNVKKYNMYNLLQSIKDTLTPSGGNSIFTSQDLQDLSAIPGLGGKLNVIQDFIAKINQYADYRNISNSDLDKIESKLNNIRTLCVAIQGLSLQSAAAVVGNFLGKDIRSQIQQLNKYVDPTKIIPTLKKINSALQSFIAIANRIQGTLRTAQLIVRLALILVKVFKFLGAFLTKLPLPNIYTTTGVTTTFSAAKKAAEDQTDSLSVALKQVNGLLSVFLSFIRYLLANSNELLSRLQILLINLEACDTLKNSDVVAQLKDTVKQLESVKEQLAIYVAAYDTKSSENTATVDQYTIRIVDEEVTDKSITNKRRRGIAFDKNGAIVAQSDLTFATNNAVIINEVKLKLIGLGLVKSSVGAVTSTQAAIIAESLSYLETNDGLVSDLNIPDTFFDLDSPDNEDENSGLGLNAFVNKLKGGKRLRRRTRKAMAGASAQLSANLASEKVTAGNTLGGKVQASTVGTNQGVKTYEVKVYEPAPLGTNPTLTATRKILLQTVKVDGRSTTEAIDEAKDKVDEYRRHPEWTYEAKQVR